jgi:hypothetical protein
MGLHLATPYQIYSLRGSHFRPAMPPLSFQLLVGVFIHAIQGFQKIFAVVGRLRGRYNNRIQYVGLGVQRDASLRYAFEFLCVCVVMCVSGCAGMVGSGRKLSDN